jgi:hypothetical protein
MALVAIDFEDHFTSIIVSINSKIYPDVSSRVVYFVFKKDHPQRYIDHCEDAGVRYERSLASPAFRNSSLAEVISKGYCRAEKMS